MRTVIFGTTGISFAPVRTRVFTTPTGFSDASNVSAAIAGAPIENESEKPYLATSIHLYPVLIERFKAAICRNVSFDPHG